jgi:hypothetical protein
LAIVNRVDLDGRDYSGTSGVPGELRFVFGAYNKNIAGEPPQNAAVILEYRLPNTRPPRMWAQMFHGLSGLAFGSSFNTSLQNLTDLVVEPNAQPGRPNAGSAIGQIRTNENAFDPRPVAQKQWELRQFALPCAGGTCLLDQVPVSQTPSKALNNSATLTSFLSANAAAAATATHVVPPGMLGGSALSELGVNLLVWNTAPDPVTGVYALADPNNPTRSYDARHGFAISTCTGCHYAETQNQNKQFHIGTRPKGMIAPMSPFLDRTLATTSGALPTDYQLVSDPNPDSYDTVNGIEYQFQYNEIWRRSCEVRRLLAGLTTPFTTPTGHH